MELVTLSFNPIKIFMNIIKFWGLILLFSLSVAPYSQAANTPHGALLSVDFHLHSDTTDSAKEDRKLPLKAERTVSLKTSQGTWISVDVHPDGKEIAFDLMGDLYTLPVEGGKATRITEGMAFDAHPRYSPDGRYLLFTSDRDGADNVLVS